MSTEVIEVRIWGQRVGAVAADQSLGCYVFEYDSKWRHRGIELAPLTMPVNALDPKFAFPALPESYKKLPGLLSDALPDDFGNALIDAWMSNKGIAHDEITTLDRLAYMGKRGMGALEFKPMKGSAKESKQPLEMKSLVEAARIALKGDFEGDIHAQTALANIIKVGTSAGGARAKAVIAWNPTTQEIRSGQFDVTEGFEHWLLKFDGVGTDLELGTSKDYGRIEYAYYLMAKDAGIDMSPCRLLSEGGRAHFMTRRFDRDRNTRLHVQSLCAMAHMDYKQRATHTYEQLFMTCKKLRLEEKEFFQIFLRMCFNVMARNCDDHTKNFAFLMRQGEPWKISPAYDVTHAHNPTGEWTSQHQMSVNGHFDDIQLIDLVAIADRFSISKPRDAFDAVRSAIEKWKNFAEDANLSKNERTRVSNDFHVI